MRPFTYARPADGAEAIEMVRRAPETKFLGGGTNLIDLMKMGVEEPAHLVDVTGLPMSRVEERAGGLRIGALVKNSELAANALVLERYPLLSQAILAGASPQIRNMATTGGNLLQRTRCYYFYDPSYSACNKRHPGSGCAAIQGYNRLHSILGASDSCVATYPGDMAVALTALDAHVVIRGSVGERTIPIDAFYKLPGSAPQIEHDLKTDELIVGVELPPPLNGAGSHYIKIRDRNSYAFALVSTAAIVEVGTDNRIQNARIALGSVAPKPWRVPAAEQALRGKQPGPAAFQVAADLILSGAKPLRYNGFKVEMAKRAVVRALTVASQKA